MFSGIIEHQAKILSREGGLFRIENTFLNENLILGQSIAHDGACMTLTHITDTYYEFFMMEESLNVTNFQHKIPGDMVNVERCIKLGDRIDGHIVSGHVDTIGYVESREYKDDTSLILSISYPPAYSNLLIKKGSISLNGVSLTIVEDTIGRFTVSLIPLTQEWTNLGEIKIGVAVNLEFDMFAKYIEKQRKNILHPEKEYL